MCGGGLLGCAAFADRATNIPSPNRSPNRSLWGRSAMGLQQMGVAAAVLSRGLDVAKATKDDGWEAALSYQLAVARVLGGAAPGSSSSGGGDAAAAAGSEAAGSEAGEAPVADFDASEVLALQARGDAAVASVDRWWPAGWESHKPAGEPDRSVLAEKLLPLAEERSGLKVVEGARVPALQGVLYVTRAPTSVPPGAVDSGLVPLAGGGGAAAVAEEEEEEEEREHVVHV